LKDLVAERIKSFRTHIGISVSEIAEILGKGNPAIYAIEQGRVFPQVDDLAKLQELYGLNLNWIVSGNGSMILNEHKKNFEHEGGLKGLIAKLRVEPENDELANEIDNSLEDMLKNHEKLKRVFNLIEEVKKGN